MTGALASQLRDEHGNIAQLLLVLDSHLACVHAADAYDPWLMLDAVRYLLAYVDGYHHTREDLVVARLAEREPLVHALLATLAAQHAAIREHGTELRRGLERAVADASADRHALARHGFALVAELRRNMALEEAVIFPIAALGIDAGEWAAIEAKAKPCADPLFGPPMDGRYRTLFEELTRRIGCECAYA